MNTIVTLLCAARESAMHRLRPTLLAQGDVKLLGDAFTEGDTCRRVLELHPDVVLLDAVSFNVSDLRTLDRAHASSPLTRVLLFSATMTERFVVRALQHGASGCLRLGTSAQDTLRAIRAVHAGELWAARVTVAHAFQELLAVQHPPLADGNNADLSPRQLEIVCWMRRGMTNKEIGRKLGISDMTVKTHAHNIFSKLEISGRMRLCGLPIPREPVAGVDGSLAVSAMQRMGRNKVERTPARIVDELNARRATSDVDVPTIEAV